MSDPLLAKVLSASADPAAKEAAKLGGELARNLFGPLTSEAGLILAENLRNAHVRKVVEKANSKSKRIQKGEDGIISARVARELLRAAAVADNEMIAEYLSGVLASARSPAGEDDDALPWSAMVSRLSTHQLRLHYGLCSAFKNLVIGRKEPDVREMMAWVMLIPQVDIYHFMGGGKWDALRVQEALYGLQADKMIGDTLGWGSTEFMSGWHERKHLLEHVDGGYWGVHMTPQGLGLFLRAAGYHPEEWVEALADPSYDFDLLPDFIDTSVTRAYFERELPAEKAKLPNIGY